MQKAHSPSQGWRITELPLNEYNLVAVFSNMDQARQAIESLGFHAIEGEDISLTGPAPEEAADREEIREQDVPIIFHVLKRVLAASIVGGIIGAVIGIGLVLALVNEAVTQHFIVGALLTALGVSTIAALLAYMSSLQASEAWRLAFWPTREQQAMVGIHTGRRDEIEQAAKILRDHGALDMYRVDREGRRI